MEETPEQEVVVSEEQPAERRHDSREAQAPDENVLEPGDPGPPEMEYPEKGRPVPAPVRR